MSYVSQFKGNYIDEFLNKDFASQLSVNEIENNVFALQTKDNSLQNSINQLPTTSYVDTKYNSSISHTNTQINNVNKKIIANHVLSLLEDMETKTLSDGSYWAKIFYHNNNGGTIIFNSIPEVLHCRKQHQYSKLYKITEFRGIDNKIELMLEYSSQSGKYNRWKQSSDPISTYNSVTDYEAIHIDWTEDGFGGLALSTSYASTYLDCSPGDGTWWYSIGCLVNYQNAIPGPASNLEAQAVILWVRVDNVIEALVQNYSNKEATILSYM